MSSVSTRSKLKNYRVSRQSIEALRQERSRCLDPDKQFELDHQITDAEADLDRLLSCVMGVTDGLAKQFLIEHFINGKTIYQLEVKFCYSREWIYKKIALGIRQIEKTL